MQSTEIAEYKDKGTNLDNFKEIELDTKAIN